MLRFVVELTQLCRCPGKSESIALSPKFLVPGGSGQSNLVALFEPAGNQEAAVRLAFLQRGTVLAEIVLMGTGGDPFAKAHTLHPVISGRSVFVAPVNAGGAEVRKICSL